MKSLFADVAELADAQVSEACDGDIVEVQVLSSAPDFSLVRRRARVNAGSLFSSAVAEACTKVLGKSATDTLSMVFSY
jgi:hypothetical protein